MSDWFDFVDKKTAPKPAYQRPMPIQRKPEFEDEPIKVEESLLDTVRMRALNFIKR